MSVRGAVYLGSLGVSTTLALGIIEGDPEWLMIAATSAGLMCFGILSIVLAGYYR